MWFIYIILSQDNSLYTGITNNLNRRLVAHQAGIASSYTRSHKPVRIIYTEQAKTKSNALKREIEIKSWSRTKKIATLKLVL